MELGNCSVRLLANPPFFSFKIPTRTAGRSIFLFLGWLKYYLLLFLHDCIFSRLLYTIIKLVMQTGDL